MLHCEFLLDSSCCYQIWPNKLLAADTNCQVASATKEQKRACLEKKQQWVFMGVSSFFLHTQCQKWPLGDAPFSHSD